MCVCVCCVRVCVCACVCVRAGSGRWFFCWCCCCCRNFFACTPSLTISLRARLATMLALRRPLLYKGCVATIARLPAARSSFLRSWSKARLFATDRSAASGGAAVACETPAKVLAKPAASASAPPAPPPTVFGIVDPVSSFYQLSKPVLSALVVSSGTAGFLMAGSPIHFTSLAALTVGTFLTAFSANTFNQCYEVRGFALCVCVLRFSCYSCAARMWAIRGYARRVYTSGVLTVFLLMKCNA